MRKRVLSDSLPHLAQLLGEILFSGDPFVKRLILVPSEQIKAELQLFLASRYGIAAGWEIKPFGIKPSRLDLWLFLFDKTPLAWDLSADFRHFAEYGLPEMDEWKQSLWEKCFGASGRWALPTLPTGVEIHFFGFSSLPPIFREADAFYYYFSPCQMFWDDLSTDREKSKRSERMKKQLAVYDEAEHPLLSNWGKWGRGLEGEESYRQRIPETSLERLQTEILTLEKGEWCGADGSIQIHSCPHRLAEVEAAYETILKWMEEGIAPSEISLYAPDVKLYAPLLEMIFKIPYSVYGLPRRYEVEELITWYEDDFPAAPFIDDKGWAEKLHIVRGVEDWERGFKQLLLAIAIPDDELIVELDQIEPIGEWIERVRTLIASLRPLEEKKTIEGWGVYLETLFPGLELKRLRGFNDSLLTFAEFKPILDKLLDQPSGADHRSPERGVSLAPLSDAGGFSPRAVWIFGLQEGAFPREDSQERDKYGFLRLLIQAEKKFAASYLRVDPKDHQEVEPSLLLIELKNYLKIEEVIQSAEPEVERLMLPPLFPSFQQKSALPRIDPPPIVNIKELLQLAKHPIKFYLEKGLGIYLPRFEREDREFALSPLDQYKLKFGATKAPLEQVIGEAQRRGQLPRGLFQEVARSKLLKDVEEADFKEPVTVELRAECEAPIQKTDTHLILPALKVKETLLIGKLDSLTQQGYAFWGEGNFEDRLKGWPIALLLCALGFETDLYFVKKGKQFSYKVENPLDGLASYLDYYRLALASPSPLMPLWAEALLLQGEKELKEAIEAAAGSKDPILQWLFIRDPLPSTWALRENWRELLRQTHAPFLGAIDAIV